MDDRMGSLAEGPGQDAPRAVRLEAVGAVATVVLDRPDRLNAIDGPMVEELAAVLRAVAGEPDVRCVVLTGAGRGFCAGGDLRQMAVADRARDLEGPDRHDPQTIRDLTGTVELLHGLPKVTVAAVNGPCAGAGLSLACACDLRIAAASAVFTTAFVRAGQTGDYGIGWLLPRLVGNGRARELLLLSRRVGADEAVRLGLVEEVVEDDAFRDRVAEITSELAGFAPLALAGMKANLVDGSGTSLSAFLDIEARRMAANMATRDAREAVAAFAEGRQPRYEGR